MPLLAPAFREINYSRIKKISATSGNETAAAAINHTQGEGSNVTADQVAGYLTIQSIASVKMAVSKE
ncbi:hypothetical protein ACOQNP_02500 [Ectopseudomonas khazarica]|uniref:hypothetical protein n=1 Tax=Ectopseudomonas khazarica TaxID=2502979 RepID=UPI0012DCF082